MVRAAEYRESGPGRVRLGELWLDPLPSSVPRARRWFDRLTDRLAWAGGREECRLLLCELVTNAILHSRAAEPWMVRVAWWRIGTALWVEVYDPDSGTHAEMRRAGGDDIGGRGLHLVDALADGWGVTCPPGGGKGVWFRMDLALADPGRRLVAGAEE